MNVTLVAGTTYMPLTLWRRLEATRRERPDVWALAVTLLAADLDLAPDDDKAEDR